MASVGCLQIEGDATFRRIVIPEGQTALRMGHIVQEGAHVAGRLATGGFDLMTSAPRSPMSLPQNWPFSSASSRIRRPASGPGRVGASVIAASPPYMQSVCGLWARTCRLHSQRGDLHG